MPPGASSGSVLPRLAGIVLPSLRVALALPLAYFAAAALAIDLTGRTDNVAAVWYANAILLAALLRHPPRAWPALLLLAGAANVADDLLFGSSLALSLGFTGRDLLEALLAASVLRRLGGGRPRLGSVPEVVLFVGVALLAPTSTATLGAGLLGLAYGAPFVATWRVLYVANALGLVTVTPFL